MPEDLRKLILDNDYVICDSYKDKKIVNFNNEIDFINWFRENKNKKIAFYGDNRCHIIFDFLMFYENLLQKFKKNMNIYNERYKDQDNKFLSEALEEFTISNNGGKYLRATLIGMGFRCFKEGDDFIALALAFEIFQTSILIHDDIIDKAFKRRGVDVIPLRYKKIYDSPIYGNEDFKENRDDFASSMALCLGDLGFYLANEIIIDNYKDNENFGLLFKYYNDVVIKTCYGEMLDVYLPFYGKYYGNEDLYDNVLNVYKLKTAWYSVIGPFCLGAILGGINVKKLEVLEDIFTDLGVAYQIKDDILGIYGDESVTGKTNSDVKEFKQTILYAYGLNTEYADLIYEAYSSGDILKVQNLFKKCGALDYANKMLEDLFNRCMERISNLSFISLENRRLILGFILYLKVRVK